MIQGGVFCFRFNNNDELVNRSLPSKLELLALNYIGSYISVNKDFTNGLWASSNFNRDTMRKFINKHHPDRKIISDFRLKNIISRLYEKEFITRVEKGVYTINSKRFYLLSNN